MEQLIGKLIELLDELVRADGTWREKRNAILANIGEDDKTNLEEFLGWFEDNPTE